MRKKATTSWPIASFGTGAAPTTIPLMTSARKEVSVIAISIFKTRLLPDPSLCQKRSNE